MNPEIKQNWLEALRSGKYQQGRGCLKQGNKYCCLGVLCDTVSSSGWCGNVFYYKDEPNAQSLPNPLADELGISNIHEKKLMYLNDWDKKSFGEIADYVEANL